MGSGRSRPSVWTRESEVAWADYVTSEWRSERSQELDKLGGLMRPAVKRGKSMTEKLTYLQASLKQQGMDMEAALAKNDQKQRANKQDSSQKRFMLRTDMRAHQRANSSASIQANHDGELMMLTWAEQQEVERKAKVEARQRSLEYARSISSSQRGTQAGAKGDTEGDSSPDGVAAWRVRVHRARRRAMLVVLTVVRLQRGLNHPRRMQRVDSFSMHIPLVLGDDCGRFVDETERCRAIVSDLLDTQADIEALEARSNSSSMRSSTVTLPPLQHKVGLGAAGQQQQHVTVTAAAAAAAVAAVDAASAADGSAEQRAAEVEAAASMLLRAAAAPASLPRMMSRRTASDYALSAALEDGDDAGLMVAGAAAAALSSTQTRALSACIDTVPLPELAEGVRKGGPVHAGELHPEDAGMPALPEGVQPRQPAASEGGDALFSGSVPPAVPNRRSEGNASSNSLSRLPLSFPKSSRTSGSGAVMLPGLLLPKLPTQTERDGGNRSSGGLADGVSAPSSGAGLGSGGVLPRLLSRVLSRGSTGGQLPALDEDRVSAPPVLSGSGGAAALMAVLDEPRPAVRLHGSGSGQRAAAAAGGAGRHSGSDVLRPLGGWHTHPLSKLDSRKLRRQDSKAAEKIAALEQHLHQEAAKLQRCEQMLGMYVNRANASWAEGHHWRPPSPVSEAEQRSLQASDEYKVYCADVVRKLRAGHIVFQVFAAEDELPLLAGGGSLDLWNADPWSLVRAARPGSMPLQGERLEGLLLGARALTQLRAAVYALAGADAAAALTVVLHLNEAQAPAALADMHARGCYGYARANVFVTVEQRRRGYRWDAGATCWVPARAGGGATSAPPAPPYSAGSGYAAMQMAWVGDAFTLGDDGARVPLRTTLLEALGTRGVAWLVSRRAGDLALLSPEGVLDVPELVAALKLRQRERAGMVVQAMLTDSQAVMRQMGSVLMGGAPGMRRTTDEVPESARSGSGGGAGGGGGRAGSGGAGEGGGVVELRTCEVASTAMVDTLKRVRSEYGGRMLVGLHRYVIHVPSLTEALCAASVFRPKLLLEGTTVHVSLEMSDLAAAPGMRCCALARPAGGPRMLLSPGEVEDLVPLLLEQDHDMRFRAVAGMASATVGSALKQHGNGATDAAAAGGGGSAPPRRQGQCIVVFCADNSVTSTAVELVKLVARPGRDEVCLVTVVPTALQQEQGRQLVLRFSRQLSRAMIHPTMDVVVKGYQGLLDCLEGYATSRDAGLVVMGSAAITTSTVIGGSSSLAAAVGSVAVACAKRLRVPLAVVTANTRLLRSPAESSRLARRAAQRQLVVGIAAAESLRAEHVAPRVLAVVEKQSQAMLRYLAGRCLDPLRGDQLLLGQVFPTRLLTTQQAVAAKRLMEAFADIAAAHHMPPVPMQLDGKFDKTLAAASEAEGVQLLALQLRPEEKGVPGEVLSLMRSSRAAVLLYRDSHVGV